MENFLKFFVFLCVITSGNFAQDYNPFTSRSTRDSVEQVIKTSVENFIVTPYQDLTPDKISGALWGAELLLYRAPNLQNKILQILNDTLYASKPEITIPLLQTLYTLFPSGGEETTYRLLLSSKHPKVITLSAVYLLRATDNDSIRSAINKAVSINKYPQHRLLTWWMVQKSFPSISLSDLTLITQHRLNEDLIKYILVVQNDRNKPGTLLIQHKNSFVRDSLGRIVQLPYLARSITNLPPFLNNGNTPTGVFTVYEVSKSSNNFIGVTPTLISALPNEVDSLVFSHGQPIQSVKDYYLSLLPVSLQNNKQMLAAYFTGFFRTEIIMHGTAIDPEYYKNEPYYPFTPSYGCMTANELWNNDGELINSAQQELLSIINHIGSAKGYLYVIEVEDGALEEFIKSVQ